MSTKEKHIEDSDVAEELLKKLIVHNDEVHSFEDVILALMQCCAHTKEQAEQCTMLVHYKGKCDVKSGSYEELKDMKDDLVLLYQLGVTIE